ncbi:hypothetical protein P280DRAFT_313771 [Massarina eburnea CBS 473.64]|uniref:ABM domain-containing protein n=1 Tax=Massarina eburnea CBS 473.64 TaxID=1395130 RepID=A0A6A6S415_9PLEO|nr:hypothetical protein P280DRAFT_313771 [Massarina eburnea CBS 473.64]
MTNQTLEIALLTLKPGTDLTVGDAKAVWDEALPIISSQKGCNAVYYGRQTENPDIAQFVVDWESLDAHKAFAASPAYGPFLGKIATLLAAPPQVFHLSVPAEYPTSVPLSAPVTECLSLYFDPSYENADFNSNWAKFVKRAYELEKESGGIGVTGGFSLEPHKHKNLAAEGEEEGAAKLFGIFIGWPSIEKHLEFRNSEAMTTIRPYIQEGPKGMSVYHVAFKKL